jgi:hypothetical protein
MCTFLTTMYLKPWNTASFVRSGLWNLEASKPRSTSKKPQQIWRFNLSSFKLDSGNSKIVQHSKHNEPSKQKEESQPKHVFEEMHMSISIAKNF